MRSRAKWICYRLETRYNKHQIDYPKDIKRSSAAIRRESAFGEEFLTDASVMLACGMGLFQKRFRVMLYEYTTSASTTTMVLLLQYALGSLTRVERTFMAVVLPASGQKAHSNS